MDFLDEPGKDIWPDIHHQDASKAGQRTQLTQTGRIFQYIYTFLHVKKTILHLGLHWNENPIYVFLVWEFRGLGPNFQIHVSVSDSYTVFPGSVHIFPAAE